MKGESATLINPLKFGEYQKRNLIKILKGY